MVVGSRGSGRFQFLFVKVRSNPYKIELAFDNDSCFPLVLTIKYVDQILLNFDHPSTAYPTKHGLSTDQLPNTYLFLST